MKVLITLISVFNLVAAVRAEADPLTLKVGIILPLSGVAAEYGTALQRGVELATSHYPELKAKVQFIYEDGEYSAAKAVQAFHKLTNLDQVDLIYVWGVSFCEALAPLAQAKKAILVTQCISTKAAKDRPYVLRFMNSTSEYVQTLLNEIVRRKWRRLALVLTENPYLEEMFDTLREQLPNETKLTVLDRYQANQNDFRSTVAKLAHQKYDAIGVFLAAGQISRFYLQMKDAQVKLASFGSNFFDSYSEIEMANRTMDGAIFANNYVAPLFQAEFAQHFNSSSQIQWAALAYEFAHHLLPCLDPTKVPLSQCLKSDLQSTGANGLAEMHSDTPLGSFVSFPLVVKQVVGMGTIQQRR